MGLKLEHFPKLLKKKGFQNPDPGGDDLESAPGGKRLPHQWKLRKPFPIIYNLILFIKI